MSRGAKPGGNPIQNPRTASRVFRGWFVRLSALLFLATLLGVSGPALAAGCSPFFTCWWLGSNYSWFDTTGTELKVDIRLPTTTPKSTDFYAVLLSAYDNANSYDQIGFVVQNGAVNFAWSYSTCSGGISSHWLDGSLYPFTSAELYTFRMWFANGFVYYAVYNSVGTQIGPTQNSTQNPNNVTPTYFLIQSTGTFCGKGQLTWYTNYLEQLTPGNVPDLTWTFENNRWLSGGVWTQTYLWNTFSAGGSESGPPYGSWATLSGLGNLMVQNWHDFFQQTAPQNGQFGWLLGIGSDGWGANGYGWQVGLYNGHNWIYEAKTCAPLAGAPCPQSGTPPPSYWQEPQFAGGPGSSPTWYAYSSTNPTIMYVNSLSKWILAYTDARNNRVSTILSYNTDFYTLYGWDPNTLRQLTYSGGTYVTSIMSIGLIFAGGSAGGIYLSLVNSNSNIEIWKSTDGLAWTQTNSGITNPSTGVKETAQRGVSAAACCGYDFFAWESVQTPGQVIVYRLGLDGSTVYDWWYTGETSQDRPTLHQVWGYIYLTWPGTDCPLFGPCHSLNVKRFNWDRYQWEFKVTFGAHSNYQIGEAMFVPGDYCGSNCVAWVLVWQDQTGGYFDSWATRMSYK